jgi:tol-pal system protein YbgF
MGEVMTGKPIAALILLTGIAVATSACWVKQEVGKQMQADIAAAQVELAVIKKAHAEEKAALQRRIKEADAKTKELTKVIDEYRRATGRSAADIGVDIERVKSDLMIIRGRQEVNEHRLGTIEKRFSIIHQDLDKRREEAERQEKERIEREEAGRKAWEGKKKQIVEIKRPQKKEDFYKLAYGLLEAGQTVAARALFDEFLKKWPRDAYSDNALYWIAESHYAEEEYREAALAFQQVREKFPKGDKSADALLKLGFCFYNLERYRQALPFLREFVQSYPRSELLSKAKKMIREARKKSKRRKKRSGK